LLVAVALVVVQQAVVEAVLEGIVQLQAFQSAIRLMQLQ
jgi:hypothetical protein|tara:strand:+ start:269 stop:385 length:117 start_codon:yes stop_codon:yes gene_type:complete